MLLSSGMLCDSMGRPQQTGGKDGGSETHSRGHRRDGPGADRRAREAGTDRSQDPVREPEWAPDGRLPARDASRLSGSARGGAYVPAARHPLPGERLGDEAVGRHPPRLPQCGRVAAGRLAARAARDRR